MSALVNVSAVADGAEKAWQEFVKQFPDASGNSTLQALFYQGGVEKVIAANDDPGHATLGAARQTQLALDEALRTARLESAQVTITVRPARRLRASDAGAVRRGDGNSLIVDLGVMRTVTGIAYLGAAEQGHITQLRTWTGAQFATQTVAVGSTAGIHTIPESFTERLKLEWSKAPPDPEVAGPQLTLVIPDTPGGIELRLGSRSLWTHPEEVQLDAQGTFTHELDITQDLSAALDGGAWPLSLALSASMPSLLTLEAHLTFERRHQVTLPSGSLVLTNAAEGELEIAIPVGTIGNTWAIAGLDVSISGDGGELRSVPSSKPSYSQLAELVLDPDHTVVMLLPSAFRRRLRRLRAIRLPLYPHDGQPVEVSAVVRGAEHGEPSAAQLGLMLPVMAQGTDLQWVELTLMDPIDLETDPELWLELNTTRGRAVWPLSDPAAVVDASERVALRRGRPGGPYRSFSVTVQGQLQELLGVVRLVGEPYADSDLPALELLLPGQATGTTVSPGPTAREISIDSDQPVALSGGNLLTTVQFRSPGTYRISAATVRYKLPNEV